MKIAVGSKNPAKIAAVRAAAQHLWPNVEVRGVDVPSGVSAMPFSDAECLAGARRRAGQALQATDAEVGVGLEGGVNEEPAGLMLLGWVAAVDRRGRQGVACTARLPLPPAIARRLRAGEELGPLMDELLDEEGLNRRGGAVSVLTGGQVRRQDKFATAVAYAFAQLVNSLYAE